MTNVATTGLGLSQIYPMIDEETDNELKIKSSSFCDPYLLVIREDFSAVVLQVDANGELDEVEQGGAMKKTQWLSGCVYKAANESNAAVYLLDTKGSLNVCRIDTFRFVDQMLTLSRSSSCRILQSHRISLICETCPQH